jgi:hypothetical protein
MHSFNLTAIDPVELAPIPDVPESYGPRNEEDQHVLALIQQGISSGQALPVDDAFFAELDAIVSQR